MSPLFSLLPPILDAHAALTALVEAIGEGRPYSTLGGSVFPGTHLGQPIPPDAQPCATHPDLYTLRSAIDPHDGPAPEPTSHHARLALAERLAPINAQAACLDAHLATWVDALNTHLAATAPDWHAMGMWAVSESNVRNFQHHGIALSIAPLDDGSIGQGAHYALPVFDAWQLFSTRLTLLAGLCPPQEDARIWRIFAQDASVIPWRASRPHLAHSDAEAVARCAALEWPHIVLQHPGTVWAATAPTMPSHPCP